MTSDRLKEEIGLLKTAIGIGAAITASVLAWLVQNYENTPRFLLFLAACLDLGTDAAIVLIIIRVRRCLNLLEAS